MLPILMSLVILSLLVGLLSKLEANASSCRRAQRTQGPVGGRTNELEEP